MQQSRSFGSLGDAFFGSLKRAFGGRTAREVEAGWHGKKSEAFVLDWPVRHDGE